MRVYVAARWYNVTTMKNLFVGLFAIALVVGASALAFAQSSPIPVVTPAPFATPFTPPSSLPPTGPLTTPAP